jgi:hypothetical protein
MDLVTRLLIAAGILGHRQRARRFWMHRTALAAQAGPGCVPVDAGTDKKALIPASRRQREAPTRLRPR